MRIPRFYQEISCKLGEVQSLSATNHRHAIQVLRLKQADALILFDGSGGEYLARIDSSSKRDSSVKLEVFTDVDRESPLETTLVLSTIKSDKMDFAIQKAVELGITHIQPMISHRSVIKIKADRMQKKIQHWQAVIVGACEQSGRTKVPVVEAPLSLEECLEKYSDQYRIGLLPTSDERFVDLKRDDDNQAVAFFIGPEGGFTDGEEALMEAYNIHTVNFGSRILRAETAVIAGLTACQQKWGDL